jgi:hypothetical protein
MARKDEGGSGGSNGFCMIDPVVLGGVINDLATMEAAITTEMKGLKTEFEKVGVPTGPIIDLTNVSHWLHDQLPMLRRRHEAAVLLESQGLQFSPGTKMLSMPEDPDVATKQAGDLAVQRVRDALDGKPPGRDGITAAIRAIQRIRDTKGQLNPSDLLFLETFYKGLGKDVYKIPDYLKNDNNWIAPTRTTYTPGEIVPTALDPKSRTDMAAAIVGGLLTLSDERRGGGWTHLPEFIQKAASDPFKVNVMPDRSWVQRSGRDADELAAFLGHAAPDERGGVVLSKRLAITAAQSVAAYQQLSAIPPPVPYGDDETARRFLHLASNNEQAMHDLLTGKNMDPPADAAGDLYDGYKTPKDFLVPITTNAWSDDGKAAAETIDWIADAKRATDPSRRQLADEAMDGVVATLTDPSVFSTEMDIGGGKSVGAHPEIGVVNPEFTRSLARDAAASLDQLADPDPKKMIVSARLFTLIATDPTSAEALGGAVYRHDVDGIRDALAHDTGVLNGAPAGRLHGLLNAAVQNVAMERGADAEEAKAEREALQSKIFGLVSGVGTKVVDTGIDTIPGIDPVDMADKLLGRLNPIDTSPVDPQHIKFGDVDVSTPTGSRMMHRYNLTKALLESGELKLEDLPSELRTSEPHPRLKSPGEFPSEDYDGISDEYHRSNESVPGVGDLQETYLSEFSAQESGIAEAYTADDPKEVKKKLGVG